MRGLSVSIVDDDPGCRCAAASLLRSLDFVPIVFESVAAFLATSAPYETSCVVTDIQMPGQSGLDLLERMRALRAGCPVILVTAYENDAARRIAADLGAFDVFCKPLGADFLQALERATRGAGVAPPVIPMDD